MKDTIPARYQLDLKVLNDAGEEIEVLGVDFDAEGAEDAIMALRASVMEAYGINLAPYCIY